MILRIISTGKGIDAAGITGEAIVDVEGSDVSEGAARTE